VSATSDVPGSFRSIKVKANAFYRRTSVHIKPNGCRSGQRCCCAGFLRDRREQPSIFVSIEDGPGQSQRPAWTDRLICEQSTCGPAWPPQARSGRCCKKQGWSGERISRTTSQLTRCLFAPACESAKNAIAHHHCSPVPRHRMRANSAVRVSPLSPDYQSWATLRAGILRNSGTLLCTRSH
jgi:hypothetical protein